MQGPAAAGRLRLRRCEDHVGVAANALPLVPRYRGFNRQDPRFHDRIYDEGHPLQRWTFYDWTINNPNRPLDHERVDQLVMEGFFYIGVNDLIQCIHCPVTFQYGTLTYDIRRARCLPYCPHANNNMSDSDYSEMLGIQWRN